MRINKAGLQLIKDFEGLRLEPYNCSANVPTIGWGSTFYENGVKVKLTDPKITKERAEQLLINTINGFEAKLNKTLQGIVLNDNQYSALVSFSFNLGIGNLQKSTLLKLVKIHPNNPQIAKEFLKWNKAGGKVLNGLTRRREAESKLYFS